MMTPICWLVAAFGVVRHAHGSGTARNINKMDTSSAYELFDLYNSTNFFDKFEFFESITDTAHYNDVDPSQGFVLYQNRSEALRLGLVHTEGDVSVIKVDSTTSISDPTGYGRKSVRLQSNTTYRHGLFITEFSHLPKPQCGSWPAFWMNGKSWPTTGEIDIYEQWNNYTFNRQTLHTTNNATVGNCTFNTTSQLGLGNYGMANSIYSPVCDVYATNNVGCSTWDFEGPFGSDEGGVYAMEWTSEHIKLWTWHTGNVPSDVTAGQPDPSTWGMPGLVMTSSTCNIDKAFLEQAIILNIDFCGDTAGNDWAECAGMKKYNSCARYVAANPGDFADVWFGVRSIAVYTLKDG